jgi:hypothetical protein
VLINGGGTIKALSAEFLFDLQQHWRKSREQVLDDVAKKYPAQYFAGMVTLAKVIRWEIGEPGAFDRPRSPEEVMDRLEQRVGPEGRRMFERFLKQITQFERRQQERSIDNEGEAEEADGVDPSGTGDWSDP